MTDLGFVGILKCTYVAGNTCGRRSRMCVIFLAPKHHSVRFPELQAEDCVCGDRRPCCYTAGALVRHGSEGGERVEAVVSRKFISGFLRSTAAVLCWTCRTLLVAHKRFHDRHLRAN